ncbi:IS66 Orf2 like protein [Alteromonadaceae bacterium 2753L.S.0a.02]|nr:IS66 Orf2 like protein [Alteromonadaceae bacterium 2753L.S.0a.02]TVZ38006.1 IS66 Orf2 like protein [Alteromonadaceae bacterium 2753L.S.0a.02]TVZ38698.1 IS66 Orf2 like protein [Alteromonadaceae bacterium 2753L.S.0a.02]TVZ41930.1 IS66 Orf2 like protein [Alteromonadaceae bacterium 2753L.S.0a.02]
MIQWPDSIPIYLHRDPVDFRKAINGLAVIVSDSMALDVYSSALFVFCNKNRSQLKVLYWDRTGFALWQKRLERDKFKWPRKDLLSTLTLTHEQWGWLLRGFDYRDFKPHHTLHFTDVA